MNDSKTTLKKLLFEHNSEANALLHANYNELETAITRYLRFIEGEPITKAFIDDIVASHTPDGFDAIEMLGSASRNGHSALGPFPPEYKSESAVVYLLLKAMVDQHACNGSFLVYGYAHGSKKFDDMAKNFLEEVARRLVAGVNRTLTLEGIEMGLDSNVSQFNYFGNHGGAVAAMATDNASVTTNQTNGATAEELKTILEDLKKSASELDADRQQAALETIEAMKEALSDAQPKPSIVKTIMNSLKGFNDCSSFATHVATLVTFVSTHFPGILG